MKVAERALTCLMVHPKLRGLLIKGPSGTGKSSFVHAFSQSYTGKRAKVIPQNITDEQLFGTINLERMLETGEAEFEPGILRDDDSVLLVDDINLLPKNTSLTLMESVHRGKVHVEREGVSETFHCSAKVVATANDREQPLSSSLSDLFDMCVVIKRNPDLQKRIDIMRIANDDDVDENVLDEDLRKRIDSARSIVEMVTIGDDILEAIVDASDRFGMRGHRGELSAARVCMASAALDGRKNVNEDDLSFALSVCVPHRRTRHKKTEEDVEDRVLFFGDSHMKRFIHDERKELLKKVEESKETGPEEMISSEAKIESPYTKSSDDPDEALVMNMDKIYDSIDLLYDVRKKKGQDNNLMRRYNKDTGKEGRYVSSCPANDAVDDLAVDATIRTAAPYQSSRRKQYGKDNIIIMPSDLRKKVREKHTSCLFFFMIDNSGSLIIRARMRAVKAAIMSMLSDHYMRKDSVAIMTFNEEFVGMLLPPTRSVGSVKKIVDDIPVGKRTPLSEALVFMHQYIGQYLRKRPSDAAFVILMTDAGANIAMTEGNDPVQEAIDIASHLRIERMECALVDTKVSKDTNKDAIDLSYALEAPYYKLEDLRSSDDIL